jgi:hypothetical protein
MKKIPEALAILFYVMIGIFTVMIMAYTISPKQKKLDCSIAEISPDFTPYERTYCRNMRMHKHLL